MKAKVSDDLKQHFRPEFLNRVDDTIVFPPLTKPEIARIVDLMIAKLAKRMEAQHMRLQLTDEARELLADVGFDPVLGARPLRRAIQREIEDALSERILFGELQPGQVVTVGVTGEGKDRTFTFITKTPPAAELIKKAAGIQSGSDNPLKNKVGKLTKDQVREIATMKLPDLNANDVEAACKIVEGTARSMGVTVE